MKRKKSFRHNSSARNQAALVRLRIALGPAGYGIYFMSLEHIYQTGQPISPDDLDLLAYEFHCSQDDLRAVLADFNLFYLTPQGYTIEEPTVEQASQPATPTVEQASQPATTSQTPSPDIVNQIDDLFADNITLDLLYDEIYNQTHALNHIIDEIAASDRPFPSQDDLLAHIRAKIRAYIASHPEIIPPDPEE